MPFFDVANGTSDYTTALGYSYSEDPNFMYCAEDMQQLDQANWWLGSCGLSGGSSGGAWMQPFSWRHGLADLGQLLGLHEPAGHGRAEAERQQRVLRVRAREEHGVRIGFHRPMAGRA